MYLHWVQSIFAFFWWIFPYFLQKIYIIIHVPDFYDITCRIILHHSQSLLIGNTSWNQLDDISCFYDWIRIPSLFCCSDGHRSFHKIKFKLYSCFHQPFFDNTLTLLNIFFSILWEENGEAAFLEKRFDLFRLDGFYFPMVDGWVIPWFVLPVLFVFGDLLNLFRVCWHKSNNINKRTIKSMNTNKSWINNLFSTLWYLLLIIYCNELGRTRIWWAMDVAAQPTEYLHQINHWVYW